MDNQPIRDERILEAIEACRPGSDDVADPALAYLADQLATDPQLADLYQRLQQVDGRLAAGFRDVPVPDGLEQRLLDHLAAARRSEAAEAEQSEETPADEPAVPASPRPKYYSRRWLLAGSGLLTAAAAIWIAVLIGVHRPVDYTPSDVRDIAIHSFKEDWDGKQWPEGGQELTQTSQPSELPLSRYVLPPSRVQMRCRQVTFLERRAVAYDMKNLAGRPATLYVVKCTVDGLQRTSPPLSPSHDTGG